MSYKNYIKAMELAPNCKYYTTVGGRTKEQIDKSEKLLGIKFSRQIKDFYENYGYLSFYGNEVFGIDPDDNSGFLEGNSVLYALNDRKEFNLPSEWIPIYNFQDGNMAYLDYSKLNTENEPRVIMSLFNGVKYGDIEILAEDFGDFLLQLVCENLHM